MSAGKDLLNSRCSNRGDNCDLNALPLPRPNVVRSTRACQMSIFVNPKWRYQMEQHGCCNREWRTADSIKMGEDGLGVGTILNKQCYIRFALAEDGTDHYHDRHHETEVISLAESSTEARAGPWSSAARAATTMDICRAVAVMHVLDSIEHVRRQSKFRTRDQVDVRSSVTLACAS